MRDADRLHYFYEEVKRIHMQYAPDLRFGQFMSNFFLKMGDPFYWEEDVCLAKLKQYVGESLTEEEQKLCSV